VSEVWREHAISETLDYGWREKLLEGGREVLAGTEERQGERELRRNIAELERVLGRTTYELEVAGNCCQSGSVVARVAQVSRKALYRVPTLSPLPRARPPADPVEQAIVEEALRTRPTALPDGRRVCTAAARGRGEPQAGAAGAAAAEADPAPPPAGAQEAAGFFRGGATAAVAARHRPRSLDRRARLVLPERDHRLLHPQGRRLGAQPPLPV
jgi:hypothetical protein